MTKQSLKIKSEDFGQSFDFQGVQRIARQIVRLAAGQIRIPNGSRNFFSGKSIFKGVCRRWVAAIVFRQAQTGILLILKSAAGLIFGEKGGGGFRGLGKLWDRAAGASEDGGAERVFQNGVAAGKKDGVAKRCRNEAAAREDGGVVKWCQNEAAAASEDDGVMRKRRGWDYKGEVCYG